MYMAAILACHIGIYGSTPVAHPMAVRFLKRCLRPVFKPFAPTWDLDLDVLCEGSFEPIWPRLNALEISTRYSFIPPV